MTRIEGVVFDYGFTLSSEPYFNVTPAGVDDWQSMLTESVFDDPDVVRPWMRGEIGLRDVAEIVAERSGTDFHTVLTALRRGCHSLSENSAVKELVVSLKGRGIPIALVTVNFDVFNDVVIPRHGYDQLFDIIVNSCDYGCIDKRCLWPIAFAGMGEQIGYHNTLLIEDGVREPEQYREMGGYAIQYIDDDQLHAELACFQLPCVTGEQSI